MSEILDEEIQEDKPLYKINTSTNVIWFSVFMLGMAFRILYWPGHSLITLIGASGFIAYNVFCSVRLKGKNTTNNIFLLLSAIWLIYVLYGFLFNKDYRHFNEAGLMIHAGLLIVFFLRYELSYKYKKSNDPFSS
jgi:hypothetical protein